MPAPDPFDLYEAAVQAPTEMARFLRALRPAATHLCEDFAGSAAISRAWTNLDPALHATAIELDPITLQAAHQRAQSNPRITLLEQDATTTSERADIIATLNFSICELHTRAELLAYLTNARTRLANAGPLVLDIYSGSTALQTGVFEIPFDYDGVEHTYAWKQLAADPISSRVLNAIDFTLPSGETIHNAFAYDWRLWSPRELIDALLEAGFTSIEAHDTLGGALDDADNPIPDPCWRTGTAWRDEEPSLPDDAFVLYLVAMSD